MQIFPQRKVTVITCNEQLNLLVSSRNAVNGHENAILEANYVCLAGYELRGSAGPLLCSEGLWVGQLPECVRLEAVEMVQFNESFCPSTNGLCDQLCSVNRQSGEHECSCYKGFAMRDGSCRGEFPVH